MKFENVMFGADPELFLIDESGKFISAIDRIGGTKEYPRPIDDQGSAVQEDNVAVEFNIGPAKDKKQFISNLYKPLSYIKKHVAEMGLKMEIVPSAMFDKDQLDHPKAQAFGCDVDYNVWTGKPNPRPKATGDNVNLRTAGGHVHVSWNDPNMKERKALVKAMDLFLGVPSVLMDSDDRRRILYGKAGAYRPKHYGVEYRVLSNFWIRSPRYMEWVFEQSQAAIEFLRVGNNITKRDREWAIQAIRITRWRHKNL
jgi:hypothetical protein